MKNTNTSFSGGEKTYIPDFVMVDKSQNISFRAKVNKFDWFYWMLIVVLVLSVISNIIFDIQWVLYLLIVASFTLFMYGVYIREKELSPEESKAESRTILYPFLEAKKDHEKTTIGLKQEEFYKMKHSDFNIKNTLIFILPLALFATLRQEFGMPLAIFIGLTTGSIIRLLYSFYNKDN